MINHMVNYIASRTFGQHAPGTGFAVARLAGAVGNVHRRSAQNFTPPLRVGLPEGKARRRGRALGRRPIRWGDDSKMTAPPTGATSNSVLVLPTPPQGGSGSSPFIGRVKPSFIGTISTSPMREESTDREGDVPTTNLVGERHMGHACVVSAPPPEDRDG